MRIRVERNKESYKVYDYMNMEISSFAVEVDVPDGTDIVAKIAELRSALDRAAIQEFQERLGAFCNNVAWMKQCVANYAKHQAQQVGR